MLPMKCLFFVLVAMMFCSLGFVNFASAEVTTEASETETKTAEPVVAETTTDSDEAEATDDSEKGVIMEGLTAEDELDLELNKESFVFQAEVNRLMDIIINSLCKILDLTLWFYHLFLFNCRQEP